MKIKVFSPIGIKPDEYRARYPELERTTEFSNLVVKALIFVWYYANPTSDLVLSIIDDYERVEEALKRSGYNPGKSEKDRILKLQFDSDMASAIKKMSEFDAGIRFRAHKMVRLVFNEYEKFIKRGPIIIKESDEENQEVSPEKNPYYVDRYVVTTSRIIEALPQLIAKLEEGFGIINISGEEVVEDQLSDIRDWHQNKDTEN